MKAHDLALPELLETSEGTIRFAGRRAIIMDALALGVLRHELIEALGLSLARGILGRFGFAHGWRTAESMKTAFPWDDETEWKRAGGRLHTLQGLVRFEKPPAHDGKPEPFAEAIWQDSYE